MRNLIFSLYFCFLITKISAPNPSKKVTTLDPEDAEYLVKNYAEENLSWGTSSSCAFRKPTSFFGSPAKSPIHEHFSFFSNRNIEIPVTSVTPTKMTVEFVYHPHFQSQTVTVLKCPCNGDDGEICVNGFVLISRGASTTNDNVYFVYVVGASGNLNVVAHLVH